MTVLVILFVAFTAVTVMICFHDNEANSNQDSRKLEKVASKVQSISDEVSVQKRKSQEFEQKIVKQEQESRRTKELLKGLDNGNKIVANQEIRTIFNDALQKAEVELDIISPWMNGKIVDNKLLQAIGSLLKRDVTVKILYGIGNDFSEDKRNVESKRVAAVLKDCFAKYQNFHIKRVNTHQKLFICDEKFYVTSSFNILSFTGTYTGDDRRDESGEYSTNIKRMAEYRAKYFNF